MLSALEDYTDHISLSVEEAVDWGWGMWPFPQRPCGCSADVLHFYFLLLTCEDHHLPAAEVGGDDVLASLFPTHSSVTGFT